MKIHLLPVLLCLAAPLMAQVQAPRPLQLKEGLELAIANSANVEKARLDRQGLEQRLKEARNAAYPRLTANLDVDYSPVLPTQVMPGEVVGQPGSIIPVQFGRAWQALGAIQAEQPLYNESLRRSKQAINLTRELTDLQVKRSEEEVIYNTALVFYQTLQTRQLKRSIDANLEKLSALQQVAELQLKNGYAIPTDVKRIKVARTNLEAQRQNLLNAILNLEQTLSFLCGLPLDGRVEPLDDLSNPAADSLTWKNLLLETRTTTEFKLLSRAIDLNRVQVRSLKAEPLPSLNAYAAASLQSFRDNANFADPDARWYGMFAVGLKIKMPLFDGFRRHNKARVLDIEGQKMDADRRQLEGAKSLEFKQAGDQLENSLRMLKGQSENVGLAREITEKLVLQYKEGVVPLTDLLNAQTALSEAETLYWQQVFTYKLAVLKLLKATGNLAQLQR